MSDVNKIILFGFAMIAFGLFLGYAIGSSSGDARAKLAEERLNWIVSEVIKRDKK